MTAQPPAIVEQAPTDVSTAPVPGLSALSADGQRSSEVRRFNNLELQKYIDQASDRLHRENINEVFVTAKVPDYQNGEILVTVGANMQVGDRKYFSVAGVVDRHKMAGGKLTTGLGVELGFRW